MGVSQGTIPETKFLALPVDKDFKKHTSRLHQACIIPTPAAAAAAPTNQGDTVDVLRQLGASMARSSKAAEAQNATQCKQLDYLKNVMKKKNKAEKWHGIDHCLVLNAASSNGNSPLTEISKSYQEVINSKTAAMADKELHSQMVAQQQAYTMAVSCGAEETSQATYPSSHSMRITLFQIPKHLDT